jgi:hypothetical protein
MSQSNDSGLNLDHLDVSYVKRKLAVIVRDLSHYTAQEMARELVRLAKTVDEKEAAKEAGRAALANQPAPTVPDSEGAFDALESYGENGDYVLASDVYDAFVKGAHQPAQEQADMGDKWHSLTCDGTCNPPCKDAQQEPVAAPQQAAGPEQFCDANCVWTDHHKECTISAPGTPEAPKPPFPITDDEMAALRRFWECATDGEGYDVDKSMMQRLAEMGLVQRKSGAYYMATDFGLYVLGEYTIQRAAQLDGGQEGSGS